MMGKFNIDNYETVKERKKRFYTDHKNGSIRIKLMCGDVEKAVLIKAQVWREKPQSYDIPPDAEGIAYEEKGSSFVNKTSWTENCEESAVGRALDNLGYAGNNKCSREERQKAERMSKNKPPVNGKVKEQQDKLNKHIKEVKGMPGDDFKKWLVSSGKYDPKASAKKQIEQLVKVNKEFNDLIQEFSTYMETKDAK